MTGRDSRDRSRGQSKQWSSRDTDVLSNTDTNTGTESGSSQSSLSVDWLRDSFPKYEHQLTHRAEIPAEPASTVPAETVLPDALAAELDHGLYTHQAEAIEHLQNGENVCAATSTASGKTWIYTLYYACLKHRNPYARALFLYPTKALSNDQKKAVSELLNMLGVDASVRTYDGDTEKEAKPAIRKDADIIITNFAALNHYLPHHYKWRRLYTNLELVVTDESHEYTGIQGMHVSWIARRLKRVIRDYYASPQYVCSTATIGNPKEHSQRLLNEEFTVITNDGSPRGKRDIGFWAPPGVQEPLDDSQRSATSEIAEVGTHLAKSGVQTLCFVRSRQGVEVVAKRARNAAETHPDNTPITVQPYHAGLSKQRRKEIEREIQSGSIDCVFSTNALELGIDIGGIDATIVGGYPGTRQSFWQQIGRAGRGTDDSLSAFVTKESAMDQYINHHPAYLLEDDVEDAVISLSNNTVYLAHVLCAADELALTSDDIDVLGNKGRLRSAVSVWRDAGYLRGSLDGRVQHVESSHPQSSISIYGTGNEEFDVQCVGGDISLEPVNKERAYREFHPGALFVHDGVQYEVRDLHENTDRKYIEVQQVSVNERTITRHEKTVHNVDEDRRIELGDGYSLHAGMATVDINYYEYVRVPIYEHGDTGESTPNPLALDPISIRTSVMWVELPDNMQERVMNHVDSDDVIAPSESAADQVMQSPAEWTFCGGLHGAEHGMIKLSPLELRIDNSDIGGLSTPYHRETGCPTWFIHDGIDGGIGFAHSIYEHFTDIAEKTRDRVGNCSCDDVTGCPSCLMSDQCGNDNEPLHKITTQLILHAVLQRINAKN